MASLLDIGPLTEEVEVRGVMLTVQGLTAGHLFQLFANFPEMRKLFDSKQGSPQEVMMSLAPELIAKIIAMVTGTPNSKEAEAKALEMGASDQLEIIGAVQRLSFKDGLGPFVDRVTALMQPVATMSRSSVTASSGSSPSTTRSRVLSSASLQMDTPNQLRGHARRDN